MLKEEENQLLMQTAPGTPMGELMRRYWQPVAAAGELDEKRIKPVRLLGDDPVHFEWLHSYWSYELNGRDGQPAPPHLKVGFDEFEYGFVYRRIQEGMTEDNPLWTVGRTCLWPNALYTGDHCEWRVPIDDTH